ncbi:hypothetical protein J8I87_37800 [Paraburkholderia sp. LEh10]|uniref:hypothetical protein n=1 Tax=Paraburkholderia sp. LEh10 TaxID=2821353 RepID=UPI001AE8CCFC|nr:hypothetical protein [Paraburkholderia sp. LEh10]MBP0595304.1 hypothetical protein [Paraburkholderia sp. LEh10]
MIFTAAIVHCVLMLCLHAQARATSAAGTSQRPHPAIRSFAMVLFIALVGANLVSAFLQNGFHSFKAGGQKHYEMLYDGDVMKP